MCGYLCTGCGKCRGQLKGQRSPFMTTCPSCGAETDRTKSMVCTQCGEPLSSLVSGVLPAGVAGGSSDNKR